MLYAEMLRYGYTHVAEFHYLHHDRNGQVYANRAELGERLLAAARTAGIKITLVPVFYQKGNFGQDPQPRQRRFISNTLDDYFQLLDETASTVVKNENALLGFGVHSLRAVDDKDVLLTYQQGPRSIPFHLHAAEQLKEVDDCVEYLKKRPIEWLLDNLPVDERFNIVHCTHLVDEEVEKLAKSKANVVLCPGTEGNLGDGIFRLSEFASRGGSWSIGTDSHISLNPLEDLRWLDYAQRLTTHKRNTFSNGALQLVNNSLRSGRRAMGIDFANYFATGKPLDAVVYNSESPLLAQASSRFALQAIVYTADSALTLGTLVNGKWVVKNHLHNHGQEIRRSFDRALRTLVSH
jgi:formimidoylglutamate deiminase